MRTSQTAAGDWISEPQKAAARAFVQHLRSRPIQEQSLNHGFRPADASVPVKTTEPHNPLVRLAQYGIQVDVPTAATPPEPAVVRNLITMWSRVVAQK